MQNQRLIERSRAVRGTVLTSLSMLVSSNCAFANSMGFATHSQAPASSWGPTAQAVQAAAAASATAAPVSPFGNVQHLPTTTVLPNQSTGTQPHSAWHNFGLPSGSLAPLTNGNFDLPTAGYQLDLGSTVANVVLGSGMFGGAPSVNLDVAGQTMTFRPGTQVTAAEYVAIREVLAGGQQNLIINNSGSAAGGSFTLNHAVTSDVSKLVIPQSVSALDYFANSRPVTLHGELVNYGSIYGIASDASVTSGSIFARDITNQFGALITTQTPGTSLILGAANSLTNSGTISSTGTLTLATNTGAIVNNVGAVASAAGNVNLISGSGVIQNDGTVASAAGNINIAAMNAGTNLNVNSNNGTFSALQGDINVNGPAYVGSADINLNGGNYLSKNFNINADQGAITASIGEVTGTLTTTAKVEHFAADASVLTLGNNCIKGDPTFANKGDINITGDISVNEDLTILAGGDIIGTAGKTISTANSQPAGVKYNPSTNITLVAGADVQTNGAYTTSNGQSPDIGIGKTATIDFASGTGGSILLNGMAIDSSSNTVLVPPGGTFNQPNGGNVTLVAYGTGIKGGVVETGDITTTSLFGNGGNVTIIAGYKGAAATAVNVGTILTGSHGSTNSVMGRGGDVNIYTQTPASADGGIITYNSDGSVQSGKIIPSGNGNISAGVQVKTIDTSRYQFFPSSPNLTSNVAGDIKIAAGSLTVLSGGTIAAQGNQSGNIDLTINAGINTNGAAITTASTANSGNGSSGNITITANSANLGAVLAGNTSVGLASASAGNISISITNGLTTANVDASGNSNRLAGDIILSSSSGQVTVNGTSGSAITGRNVLIAGLGGVSITAPGGATTVDILSTGSVTVVAGSLSSPANITIAGGITTASSRPGYVELVNNSITPIKTAAANLTVGGVINTNTSAKNGSGGSVSVVSSGGIKLGNITTMATGTNSSSARGGGVFISSGGLGTNAITVGTVNTSAFKAAGNTPGQIIMISPAATKTALNPSNIKHGTVTADGGVKGVPFYAGLAGIADELPFQINIIPTIGGATPINIRPGGYQNAVDTSAKLITTINNPYATLLAPINIADGNTSNFYLITQKNSVDNFSIVNSGQTIFNSAISTSVTGNSVSIVSLGGIQSAATTPIELNSANGVTVFAPYVITAGMKVNAFNDIVVSGAINASGGVASTNGYNVILHSEIGSVTTSHIDVSVSGSGFVAGNVGITANNIINVGNIDAAAHDGIGGYYDTGAGAVSLIAGTQTNFNGQGVRVGNIDNQGDNLVRIASYGNSSIIKTGDIKSSYFDNFNIANVEINSGGYLSTGNITTTRENINGGTVSLTEGGVGANIGFIDTSSLNGGKGGRVYIYGGGSNSVISVQGIKTSTNGFSETGDGGDVVITNSNGAFNWGSGGINTSANYATNGIGDGGDVLISISGNIYGYGINTSATNSSGVGNGGSVFVSGNSLWMSTINTSAYGVNMNSGTGGNVMLASGSGTVGETTQGINTTAISTKGIDQGGNINEVSQGFIVHADALDLSSKTAAGSLSASAYSFIFTFDINASATNNFGFANGGNVMLATAGTYSGFGALAVSGTINTSATSNTFDAKAGSVGVANAFGFVNIDSVNASAVSSNANTYAGDVFLSAAGTVGAWNGGSGGVMTVNTSGSTSAPGTVFKGQIYAGSDSLANIAITPTGGTLTTFSNTNTNVTNGSTIKVTTGGVTIQQGSYDNIGSSSTPVSFNIDLGGDSRLLVPIISTGGIFIGNVSGNNTNVATAQAYQNNGYGIHLINMNTGLLNDVQLSGNITANQNGSGTKNGDVEIVNLFSSILQTDATKAIGGENLSLTAFGHVGAQTLGGNGYLEKIIHTDAYSVTANALTRGSIGAANVFISTVGTNPVVFTGINTANGASGQFALDAPSGNLDINGLILGSKTLLFAETSGKAINLGGSASLLGFSNASQTSIQATNVVNNGTISAGQIFIETTYLDNTNAITATRGALALDQSVVANTQLTLLNNVGSLTSPTQLSITATGLIDLSGLIKGGVLTLAQGESLFVVSGDVILSNTGGNFSINTSSSIGNAGSVALLSGVKYSIDNGSGAPVITIDTNDYLSGNVGSIKIDGTFGPDVLTSINTSSAVGAGGDVFILAAAPGGKDAPIRLGLTDITAGGATRNGEVALIALGLDGTQNGSQYGVQVGAITSGTNGNHLGSGGIDIETGTLDADQTITLAGGSFNSGFQTVMPSTILGGAGKVGSGLLKTNLGYLFGGAVDDLALHFDSGALNAYDIELTSLNGTVTIPIETTFVDPLNPTGPRIGVISVGSKQDGSGDGGTIKINGASINFSKAFLTLGADATGPFGDGGIIEITSQDDSIKGFNVFNGIGYVDMYARGGQSGGNGGSITMHTDAVVVVDTTSFKASPIGPNGNGATYDLEAHHFDTDGSSTVIISANGTGTGDGGNIFLSEIAGVGTTISSPKYLLSATSGPTGGNGGYVSFQTGGNLMVNPAAIKVNPLGKVGDGGKIRLIAGVGGGGDLLVTAPLVVSGKGTTAKGGTIVVGSNSTTPMLIGVKTVALAGSNGLVGTPVAAGKPLGQFTAENLNGDIKTAVALTGFQQTYLHTDNAGSIILGGNLGNQTLGSDTFIAASGSGKVTNTAKTVVALGDYLSVFSKTGDIIGFGGTPFTVSSNTQRLQGNDVNVSEKTATSLVGVYVTDTLTMTSTKNIVISNSYVFNAPTLVLNTTGIVAGNSTGTIYARIDTQNLSVANGTFNLKNESAATINVNSVSKAKLLTLQSATDIFVPGSIGSTTTNINFITSNDASINTAAAGMITGKDVNLSTIPYLTSKGGIGTLNPININAVNVSAISGTKVDMKVYAATTTLGDIQANNGNVDVNTAGTLAKVLQTRAATTKVFGAEIYSLNGHVTLQNNNLTKGSIVIGKGTNVSTLMNGKDVTISIGQVITPSNTGPQPTGIVYYVNNVKQTTPPTPANFFFGAMGITVAGTSATPGKETINMNSVGGGRVIFDTNGLAKTAIKINGNTTTAMTRFTADPPIVTNDLATPAITAPTLNNSFSPANLTNGAPIQLASSSAHASTIQALSAVPTVAAIQVAPTAQSLQSIHSIQATPTFETVSLSNIAATQQSNTLTGSATRYVAARESRWATETELTTGEIPAIVYCEEDMGVGIEQSTVVEMHANKDSKRVTLNRGTVVFAPTSDTVVETPMGSISVGADSVVLVTVNGQGTAVYDLDDARHNSVRVTTAKGDITLSPGRHLMLTSRMNAAFADVNQAQMIGYRNIREHQHTGNMKAFTADFAVHHAVAVVQPVKQMFNCKNTRSKKLSTHMLKTMSIMMSLDAGRGGYQQMLKPKLTAWAP